MLLSGMLPMAVTTTVRTANTAAKTAQTRAAGSPLASTAVITVSTGAPRNNARKTGLTIARFIDHMACTKVRSSTLASPGITPDAHVQ